MRAPARLVSMTLFLMAMAASSRADGPTWRRDVWWDVGTPTSQYHIASAIWLDAQDRVHVAYNGTSGSLPVSHMLFDAGFEFEYLDGPLGGLGGDNSIAGDRATGEVALLSTDELQVTLMDPLGQQVWQSRGFPGTGVTPGLAAAGIVMHPSGDFIAVGGYGADFVYAARFRRSDGGVVWSVVHGPLGMDTVSGGIALDPAGNVIVANHSRGNPPELPVLFRIDGGTGAMSAPVTVTPGCAGTSYVVVDAVAADAAGNVYAAGELATGGPSGSDGFVVKMSSSFSPIWCTTQGDGTPFRQLWNAMAVDGAGRIVLTGLQDNANGFELA